MFCLKKESKTGSSPDYSLFLGREKALRSKIEGIPIKDRSQGDSVFHAMEQVIPPHGTKCSTPWNKQEGGTSLGRRYRFRGSNVPPSRVECAAFVLRRYGLRKAACHEKRSLKTKISLFFNKICKSATKSANPQTPVIQ